MHGIVLDNVVFFFAYFLNEILDLNSPYHLGSGLSARQKLPPSTTANANKNATKYKNVEPRIAEMIESEIIDSGSSMYVHLFFNIISILF
jgi:hypothetical protein